MLFVLSAFTGARASQPGLIEEAGSGTLFLDEIDCLPLLAQVKLLRFIQEKEYKPLGSSKARQADVRIMAATNVDLAEAVAIGKFRRDLYYRLNIIPLSLPPLRERKEDIGILARHFLTRFSVELDRSPMELSSEAVRLLTAYDWQGNVRELENIVERAVIFAKTGVIEAADVMLPRRPKNAVRKESFKAAKARAVEQFEKNYIQELLLASKGNISQAAKIADKNRRAFWELIRRHKIDVERFRSAS